MILTVVIITSSILGVALVAGMLIVFQIRSSGDFANTNKAIFAADAGTEWWLYNYYKDPNILSSTIPFSNGASFEVFEQPPNKARIVGMAGKSKRAFFVEAFESAGVNCKYDLVLLVSLTNTAGLSGNFDTYKNSLKNFTDSLLLWSGGNTYIAVSSYSHYGAGVQPAIPVPVLTNNSSTIRAGIDSMIIQNVNNNLSEGLQLRALDSILTDVSQDRDDLEYPDAILVISDRLPNRPNPVPLTFARTTAEDIKDLGVRIMANIINPSSNLALDNFYLDDIVSDDQIDYSSSLDYDTDFNNKLVSETLSNLCGSP